MNLNIWNQFSIRFQKNWVWSQNDKKVNPFCKTIGGGWVLIVFHLQTITFKMALQTFSQTSTFLFFFFLRFCLFERESEQNRESTSRGRGRGRRRSRLLVELGAHHGAQFQGSGIMTWAEGRCSTVWASQVLFSFLFLNILWEFGKKSLYPA